jgi:tRNA threonylcarbamoyl adenosine modification protein YeaZ
MADRIADARRGPELGPELAPGPYTGLRVGLVTAAAFGDALGVPVHGVCTLDGIAYAAGLDEPFVVATDARRKEVYWARYLNARTRVTEAAVDRPAEIAEAVAGLPAVGAGAALYPDVFTDVRPPAHQSAGALAALAAVKLAEGEEFLPALPLYLRRPDAQVPAGYKAVLPK